MYLPMNRFKFKIIILFLLIKTVCYSTAINKSLEIKVTSNSMNCSVCRAHDSIELIKFFDALNGANWIQKTNWKVAGQPINTWYGITLNANGCVSRIYFSRNNLKGKLYNFDFPELTFLSLTDNLLTGTIPNFDNLPQLETLELGTNQLTGNIPNFDKLPRLFRLHLDRNLLSGAVPNFNQFPVLTSLRLSSNQLKGSLPIFDSLPLLNYLHLNQNQFTGAIPNFNLPVLNTLDLSSNQLNGSIPNFDNLQLLSTLQLGLNQLTGNIPNFDNLLELSYLDLYTNKLSGIIPNFNKMTNLRVVILGNNEFTGNMPSFDKHTNLQELNIQINQLTGSIPNFSESPNLTKLILFSNKLSGSIPSFDATPELKQLYLFNNQLTGAIPNFDKLSSLQDLLLNNNLLSGCFSSSLKKFCRIRSNFSNNPQLPWLGDFSKFCKDSTQVGSPCNDMDSTTVNDKIDKNCNCVGTSTTNIELVINEGFDIYPNPTKDIIYIDLRQLNEKVNSIGIYNAKGNKIEDIKNVDQNSIIKYQCNECMSDVYIIQINTQNNSVTKKFVLMK